MSTTLTNQAISAFRWLTLARLTGQVFTWASTIVVIRLLEPSDYGLMALAGIFTELLMLFNELGIGAALVQRDTVSSTLRRQCLTLLLVINAGLYLMLFTGGPYIATWFDSPSLSPILWILGVPLLFAPFGLIGDANLRRNMRYKQKAGVEFVAMVIGTVISLSLAILGYGVWALVAGAVSGNLCRSLGFAWLGNGFIKPELSISQSRSIMNFGASVMGERILWWVFSQSDNFIAGKLIGKQSLGYYGVAMQIASLPMQKLASILNDIGLAALSKLQGEPEQAKQRFLQVVSYASVFSFPVFWGIAAIAPEFVAAVLGDTWAPVAPLLTILGITMPLRMIAVTYTPMLIASNQPKVALKARIIAVMIFPAGFAIGATQYGIEGLTVAWLVLFPPYFLIHTWMTLNATQIKAIAWIQSIGAAPLAAAVMGLAVFATRVCIETYQLAPWLAVAAMVPVGAISFGATLLLLQRELVLSVLKRLKP